jgi:triosephosphate isomerase
MNKSTSEARAYVEELKSLVAGAKGVEIVLCPPFTCLAEVGSMVVGTGIRVSAQNMHYEASGAYTGEISAGMLTDIGVTDVILGHSERREYYCEDDDSLARKVPAALAAGIRPILCVGESDAEREAGSTEDKLKGQLTGDLASITAEQLASMIIAYEPIWAIGTGKTATPGIAQEACAFIRKTLAGLFGDGAAAAVRIQYGGSVKPGNISELMAQDDIDGALVGGACLTAADFAAIVDFDR